MSSVKYMCVVIAIGLVACSNATRLLFHAGAEMDTYGDRVTSETVGTALYESDQGWTPNVITEPREVDRFNYTPGGLLYMWLGGGSYGDMYPGIFANDVGEMRFIADPGYKVLLYEFNLGGWPSTDQDMAYCRALDAAGNVLWDSGATTESPLIAAGQGRTTFTFNPPLESEVIRFHWGYGSSIGTKYITFGQSPSAPTSFVCDVSLSDFGAPPEGIPAQAEVRVHGQSEVVQSFSGTLDSNGFIVIPTSLETGTYDVSVKASHWLRKMVQAVSLTAGESVTVPFLLANGDIDGDNAVTLLDYDIFSTFYDKSSADSDWDTVGDNGFAPSAADLDGDETNTLLDYDIFSASFDSVGDD